MYTYRDSRVYVYPSDDFNYENNQNKYIFVYFYSKRGPERGTTVQLC